jgi:hypothetical protein|tara:strand:- start:58 stop:1413 length:1356 start_codon:yes stop_codon:yes gene_type:complete
MANYNSGIVNVADPGAVIDSTIPSRRLFNFSDRVAELAPDESPFFVYLSKVAKVPTDDPQFRFLEDRTKVAMTDRSFLLVGSHSIPAAGSQLTYSVDTSDGASVDWLLKGMVFAVDYTETNSPETIIVRVESAVTDGGATSSFTGRTISAIDGAETGADNSSCTVIGTSYSEGSGAPDVFSQELDNDYGLTQIFKTACEMSNTARATRYRGYADEWQRTWNLKLREHKIDIERAMLFGQRASQSGINYTEGISGHIIKNGTAVVNDAALSYSEGAPYFRSSSTSELTYDRLLSDFEVVYDPARGGSQSKLALASLPVITFFNKLGADFFVNRSMMSGTSDTVNDVSALRYNMSEKEGSFGHKIMMVDTIHGSMALVKEPLFRGFASGFLQLVDLDHVSYRPLVGNGVNRDTHIISNVQSSDEDLRKDMILTEAGLEVSLPETHYLLNLEGV